MGLQRWTWQSIPSGTRWGTTLVVAFNTRLKTLENYLAGLLGLSTGRKTLEDAATTPLVTQTRVVLTANTGPTSITGFRGGESGQGVVVLAGDNDTTLVHGTTLRLDQNTDWVAKKGECRQFVTFDGATWYESPRTLATPDT